MPGTMRKRGGDSWYLEVTIGTDFRGRPIRYNKTVHGTKKQAEKELAIFYTDCEKGNITKSCNLTVEAYCDYYTENCMQNIKRTTQSGYHTIIRKHIKPHLGTKKLNKLTTRNVQEWVKYLGSPHTNKSGNPFTLSPKTIKNIFSALDKMLSKAVILGFISKNPCDNVELFKVEKRESDFYNIDETIALLEALELTPSDDLKYKVGIWLALFCGLRKSEILGLNWDHVNFNDNTLEIDSTRLYTKENGNFIDTPKSNNSTRLIAVPDELAEMLKNLLAQQRKERMKLGSKWVCSNMVLTNHTGAPIYRNALPRWFTKFLDGNGLRHISLHKLRHTHTSLILNMGVDKMQASKRLGHSEYTTTLNIYGHLFKDTDYDIAELLSDNFIKSVLTK